MVKAQLGANTGKHKLCGVQLAAINEGQGNRFRQDSIMLAALAKASAYKKYGMCRVLCGKDSSGFCQFDEPNFAKDMRRLDEGVWIQLPDDENGGLRWWCLKAWIVLASCDMPAAGSIVPYSGSARSNHFCRCCTMDASNPDSKRPFSFLRKQQSYQSEGVEKRRRVTVCEHTWDSLEQSLGYLKQAFECGPARDNYAKSMGLVPERLVFAFDPREIPYVDPCNGLPQDLLHLFPDGLLRSEAAWLIYTLAKLGLSVATINQAIASYHQWPEDVRIPELSDKLEKGKEGGVPDSTSTLKMSGSQVMHFSLHRYVLQRPAHTLTSSPHPSHLLSRACSAVWLF